MLNIIKNIHLNLFKKWIYVYSIVFLLTIAVKGYIIIT
jgi:hypothetical protein